MEGEYFRREKPNKAKIRLEFNSSNCQEKFWCCLASSKWLTEKRVKRIESFVNWFLGNLIKSRHDRNISCCAASIISPRIKPSLKSTQKVNPEFQREQNWFHGQRRITVFSLSRCALKRLHQYLELDADRKQYPGPCWVSSDGWTNTNNLYSHFIWYPLNETLLSFSSIFAMMWIWRVRFDF